MGAEANTKGRGRPRTFDVDVALGRALRVFWQKGYDGTAISDLTEAMGINAPSLYAAFGNKENLFHRALERYGEGPASYVRDSLNAPTARQVAERRLFGAAEQMTNPEHPWGCMAVQAAVACSESAAPIREQLIAARASTQEALRLRFVRAVSEGDLPTDADPDELAAYLSTVIQGMSVQAASGASRGELLKVASRALQAWPT